MCTTVAAFGDLLERRADARRFSWIGLGFRTRVFRVPSVASTAYADLRGTRSAFRTVLARLTPPKLKPAPMSQFAAAATPQCTAAAAPRGATQRAGGCSRSASSAAAAAGAVGMGLGPRARRTPRGGRLVAAAMWPKDIAGIRSWKGIKFDEFSFETKKCKDNETCLVRHVNPRLSWGETARQGTHNHARRAGFPLRRTAVQSRRGEP